MAKLVKIPKYFSTKQRKIGQDPELIEDKNNNTEDKIDFDYSNSLTVETNETETANTKIENEISSNNVTNHPSSANLNSELESAKIVENNNINDDDNDFRFFEDQISIETLNLNENLFAETSSTTSAISAISDEEDKEDSSSSKTTTKSDENDYLHDELCVCKQCFSIDIESVDKNNPEQKSANPKADEATSDELLRINGIFGKVISEKFRLHSLTEIGHVENYYLYSGCQSVPQEEDEDAKSKLANAQDSENQNQNYNNNDNNNNNENSINKRYNLMIFDDRADDTMAKLETHFMRKLSHKNICKYFDHTAVIKFDNCAISQSEYYALKLEYLPLSLDDLLRRFDRFDRDHGFRLLKHIGKALHYLHESKRIALNALTPAHIRLTELAGDSFETLDPGLLCCQYKLADFTQAKQYCTEIDVDRTRETTRFAAAPLDIYVAPEKRARTAGSYNPFSADMFAFGVTLLVAMNHYDETVCDFAGNESLTDLLQRYRAENLFDTKWVNIMQRLICAEENEPYDWPIFSASPPMKRWTAAELCAFYSQIKSSRRSLKKNFKFCASPDRW